MNSQELVKIKEAKVVIHKLQKRWVFTLNASDSGDLPPPETLMRFLDRIAKPAVFQLEKGETTGRLHYQGRLTLKGERIGKKALLALFAENNFPVKNLTFQQEIAYNESEIYCTKRDTRIDGPWYVGNENEQTKNYIRNMELRQWQKDFLNFIRENQRYLEDRKVILVEDERGGSGKSKLLLHMKTLTSPVFQQLPFDKPDRIRHAVCKICKETAVDVFGFDFVRTQGEETSLRNLFQVIEELKNQYIVSVMYGNFSEVIIKAPIIVIFTNYRFDELFNYLSMDRWVHLRLTNNEIHYVPTDGFNGHPAGWGGEEPILLKDYQPCIDYETHKHGEQGNCSTDS